MASSDGRKPEAVCRSVWSPRARRPAGSGYRSSTWAVERPWAFPRRLWTIPWWPLRLYLHVGDRLLFLLWWHTVPVLWRLEEAAGVNSAAILAARHTGGGATGAADGTERAA